MNTQATKNTWATVASLVLLALSSPLARADYLPNNFWPNPGFENGSNLDAVDGSGTPTGWNRGGNDGTICQVTSAKSVSPTHSLAVVDNSPTGYGEWYSDLLNLSGHASPGDLVTVQWYELYSISGGEMRLTVGFFDSSGGFISETHFVATGQSAGWQGSIGASTFTKRSQNLAVPTGAGRMRIALASAGPAETLGVMVVDNVSVALPPQPVLLAGNFWPNPSFESGSNLNAPTGTPTGWNRGGNDSTICRVSTNNYVSSDHALALIDGSGTGYGEWYSDLTLSGHTNPGDTISLQWFELYSVTNGPMRLSVLFFNSGSSVIGQSDYNASGQSAGWQGAIAGSWFTRRNQQLVVPVNAVRMRVSLVSGGPASATGVMLIDDLSVSPPPPPPLLPGNFWPNPTFEAGVNLNQPDGTPDNWVRTGGNTNLCQVTTNNYTSATHALALVDTDEFGYGEWDADVMLVGNASPGDVLNFQWMEMYAVTNGEMRVTVIFYDAGGNTLKVANYTATGNSGGWQGDIASSSFTVHKAQLMIPDNAARLRVSLVSGGSLFTTGLMIMDDLSVARVAMPPTVLSFNFFPNPTFEDGAQMDNPTVALPSGGWQRGGSDASIGQVITNNSVSPSHSLALIDNNPTGYGEWYLFLDVSSLVAAGDAVDIQWFQLHNIPVGNMRLSFAFLDSGNNTLAAQDFDAVGQSPGWAGSIAASQFTRQFQRLAAPDGTARLRVNFASGGDASATGSMVIDDLSVRVTKPLIVSIVPQGAAMNLTWYSAPAKTYAVLFTETLSATPTWTPLATGLSSGGLTTSYLDSADHSGNGSFYRVVQE
jgi:hypothetical protein